MAFISSLFHVTAQVEKLMNNVLFPSKGKTNRQLHHIAEIHAYPFLDIFE